MIRAFRRRRDAARGESAGAASDGAPSGGGWRDRPTLVISAWAFADQALMSGTNFATTLMIGRAVAPAEFGKFVLAYTGLWFFQGIQRALIVEPMNVLAAGKGGDEYRRYVTGAAVIQALFAALAGMLMLLAAAAVPSERNLLLAFSLALVSWQCQEFVRRIFYNRTQGAAAFINDAISYGGQILILIVLYQRGDLTPASALLVVAATSALGVVVGLWQARAHLCAAISLASVKEAVVANWHLGGWLLGASSVQEASGRLYILLLTAIIAPSGLGALTAAVTLCRLPDVFWRALDTALPPQAARRLKEHSKAGMEAYLKRIAWVGIPAVFAVIGVLVIFAGDLLHIVYGGKYDEFASVVRIAAVASLAHFLSMILRVALKSMKETRPVFVAGAASGIFSLTVGLALALVANINGAAWEVSLSPMFGLAVLAFGYWRISQRRNASPAAGSTESRDGVLKRWLRPAGLTVAVLGPDGAGKSTVIREGLAELSQAFPQAATMHFPPRLPWSGAGRPVTDPHGKPPRPSPISALKVIYWIVALNVDYHVRLRPRLVRGELLFFDRCLLDVLVDPRRYRYGGPQWLARVAWRLTPGPNVVVLLDAPVDTLMGRKQEISLAEADRQGREYRELIRHLPNGWNVDASRPLASVVADVTCVIQQFRTDRTPGGRALEFTHEQRRAGP